MGNRLSGFINVSLGPGCADDARSQFSERCDRAAPIPEPPPVTRAVLPLRLAYISDFIRSREKIG